MEILRIFFYAIMFIQAEFLVTVSLEADEVVDIPKTTFGFI